MKRIDDPAGECPIKFSHFWDLGKHEYLPPNAVIVAWFYAVREYGLRRGEFYTAEAIALWVTGEFDQDGDEFKEIATTIIGYAKFIGEIE